MKILDRRRVCLLYALVALMVFTSIIAVAEKKDEKDENATVARIGDKVITETELQEEIKEQGARYSPRQMGVPPQEQQARQRKFTLHRFIDRILIQDYAVKMNLAVPEADVQAQIDEIKNSLPDNMSFDAALKQQNITVKDLEEKISEVLLIKEVMRKVASTTPTISQAEIKDHYAKNLKRFKKDEEVRARHILIKVDKNASKKEKEEARKKTEELRKKILEGDDFAKVAMENSDCPSGKRAGGDLGFFGHGRMVPAFDKAAFALKPGETSEVLETQFGFHIIQTTDKHEARTVDVEEAEEELRQELIQQSQIKAFTEWLKNEKARKVSFTNPEDKEM